MSKKITQIQTNPNEVDRKIVGINPYRYKGYYMDVETGLYYCNARYYDPKIYQWIQPATASYLDQHTINGLELYNYACANPVNIAHDYSNNMMISSLSLIEINMNITLGNLLHLMLTNLPPISSDLRNMSKKYDIYSGLSHSVTVAIYVSKNSKFIDELISYGLNPTKSLFSLPKIKWIEEIGYLFYVLDFGIAIYDNVRQGNSFEETLLDGCLSVGISVLSSWLGGVIGSNIGGLIGSLAGSFIPIPVLGSLIGYFAGTIIGIGASLLIDYIISSIKDEILDSIFG